MNCEACGHENLDEARFCAKCGVQITRGTDGQGGWIGRLVGGRFRVNSVLGEGGMGIVYEGEQQMGSKVRRVAIKTLHAHLSSDPSVLARFHRECGTVAELQHPNTIKFYDFGKEQDGTLYIAMEFLDGRSLDKVIDEEGALPPTRVVKIMRQICGALDEAHGQGVIHRDLKPENVVLSERLGEKDFVKVLDFGIAARSESADSANEAKLTQQGMVLGTPPYMSPEQFTGVELDRRSDVYSLGVMVYEMLTAQLPFTANTPWQWATEHMTAQPFPIDQVPSGAAVPRPMRDAVMRALAKDPDERPATAGEFLKDLEAGLAGVAASISAPTEAMQAVAPAFTQSRDGSSPISGSQPSSTSTQSEMSATQAIVIPQTKSKVGMIAAAAIAVLVLGGGAMAMMGSGDKEEKPEADPTTAASASAEAKDPPPTPENKASGDKVDPPDPSPAVPAPAVTPKPTPTTTSPSPAVTPKPEPTPADECSACISAVQSGSWSSAVSKYQTCSPTGQAKCSSEARRAASSAVSAAVKKKQCDKARSIVSSAKQLNASSGLLNVAAEKCK